MFLKLHFNQLFQRPLVIGNYHLTEINNYVPKQTTEEALGLPPRPKKPLSPYFRFVAANRVSSKIRDPKLSVCDEIKRLSKEWHTIDEKEKQRLQDEYRRDLQTYVEQRARYDAKLTDNQRQLIKEARQERSEARNRRILRKRIKELGKPKRPPSAFFTFISNERKKSPEASQYSYREWQEKCTKKWSEMPANEKEVYLAEGRKLLEKYKFSIQVLDNFSILSVFIICCFYFLYSICIWYF